MEYTPKKLWNKDFSLVVVGQVIALFGNAILRFALSLYVLEVTDSAAIFGGILALSMIPTIILTPFGGMMADRLNRRNIMVALDFITALLVCIFALILGLEYTVILVAVMLCLLAIIQSFYTPAVQSSVPFLQEDQNLIRANAVVNQVTMLSNLVGPVLGGLLYGMIGIKAIIVLSGICFAGAAVMEMFIHMPFVRQPQEGQFIQTVKNDFRESFAFMFRTEPDIFKVTISVAALNLFASAAVLIGLPYIIITVLNLGGKLFGIASGLMAGAGVLGGVITGIVANRLKLSKIYIFYIALGFCFVPIGLAFYFPLTAMTIYYILVTCVMFGQIFATIISVFLLSAVQQRTPNSLLGKVMAFIMTLAMCVTPIGQVLYGFLFDAFTHYLCGLFAIIVVLVCGLGWASKGTFARLD